MNRSRVCWVAAGVTLLVSQCINAAPWKHSLQEMDDELHRGSSRAMIMWQYGDLEADRAKAETLERLVGVVERMQQDISDIIPRLVVLEDLVEVGKEVNVNLEKVTSKLSKLDPMVYMIDSMSQEMTILTARLYALNTEGIDVRWEIPQTVYLRLDAISTGIVALVHRLRDLQTEGVFILDAPLEEGSP